MNNVSPFEQRYNAIEANEAHMRHSALMAGGLAGLGTFVGISSIKYELGNHAADPALVRIILAGVEFGAEASLGAAAMAYFLVKGMKAASDRLDPHVTIHV